MAPLYRFADATWRSKADTNLGSPVQAPADGDVRTVKYPILSIDDEVRYTLGAKVRGALFFSVALPAGPDAHVKMPLEVPATFQLGDRVALVAESSVDGLRIAYPPVVQAVVAANDRLCVPFELRLPREYANRNVGLSVHGTVVPAQTALYHRTPSILIPRNAYLDFAIGVEAPAWEQGGVEFRIRACVADDCETLLTEVLDPLSDDERIWHPRRLDLAPLADRQISFSFESVLLSRKRDAFSLPVWGNPTVYAPVETEDRRPNIILISLDTLSAQHLSTYGYEFPTAPFLDGVLARDGTVFDRVVAASTTTPQSHMSMFTSVQPCAHGVLTGMEHLRDYLVTLAEVLRSAGYETGAVTEDGWLGYQHGFGRGFNSYSENKSANVMIPEGQFDKTLAKTRSWILRNRDKRFFLFVHTFQVHDPYTPPGEYKKLFRLRDGAEVDEASPRPLRDLVAYDEEIRYADDQLSAFFAYLRDSKLLDDTVVIVTADHGEEFFEHGEWGHGRNMYDEVTRIPLVIWGPGRVAAGVRRADTVGHIDLMPTILALAGVNVPAQATGRNLLAPGDLVGDEVRFTESRVTVVTGKNYELFEVLPPSFMVQQGTRKMSRYRQRDGFSYEAYDLDTDPRERSNQLPGNLGAYAALKRLLDEYETTCARTMPEEAPLPKVMLDPAQEQKLRALGYLQ